METDIRLHPGHVEIDTSDLWVHDTQRSDGPRRALVHGPVDSLIVNRDNDYAGGVTIQGLKLVEKDPDSMMPVQFVGGLGVRDGDVEVCDGGSIALSSEGGTDATSGHLQQKFDGLHVSGGPAPSGGGPPLPVHVESLEVSGTIGDDGDDSHQPMVEPATPDGDPGGPYTARVHYSDTARQPIELDPGRIYPRIHLTFDVFETLVDLMTEVQQLRNRVAQLEGSG